MHWYLRITVRCLKSQSQFKSTSTGQWSRVVCLSFSFQSGEHSMQLGQQNWTLFSPDQLYVEYQLNAGNSGFLFFEEEYINKKALIQEEPHKISQCVYLRILSEGQLALVYSLQWWVRRLQLVTKLQAEWLTIFYDCRQLAEAVMYITSS